MGNSLVETHELQGAGPILLRAPLEAVACGFPSPAQDFEEHLDLTRILIDDEEATFLVRAAGSSMIDAGIYDGDVLIVDRSKGIVMRRFQSGRCHRLRSSVSCAQGRWIEVESGRNES